MRLVCILVAICALLALTQSIEAKKSYAGYKLYSVFPKDAAQVDFVAEQQGDTELDFWYEFREGSNGKFDIFVPPHKLTGFEYQMTSHQIEFIVANHNVQHDIDLEELAIAARNVKSGRAVDYDNWNRYGDITAELDILASRCPSGYTCDTFSIGQSYEGRDIRGLRIYVPGGSSRKVVWLDATIHAREWLATATHLKIMKHLIDDAQDAKVAELLSKYDFWLIPVNNPDGYEWAHTNERLWRKSRNVNAGSTCIGVDLNRNYDQMFGNAGTSTNPCSETFRGPNAASEPETRNSQLALSSIGSRLLISIHFHTYGSLWLQPWGSVLTSGACNYATDDAEMLVVANAAADAVQNTHNIGPWARGNSCATIYPASGLTMDYAKAVGGVKYTYTPELRGNNFVVAVSQIQPSYEEVWNGLVAAISAVEMSERKG